MIQLTPREIVRELDRYIIGQDAAKRAVAVALRNRYRRAQLAPGNPGGSHPEEHPHGRPHGRWQNRNRPPPGQAGGRALCQG